MSPTQRDSGRTIDVAVGDDITDEHTRGDDSKISPGDGAVRCQDCRRISWF